MDYAGKLAAVALFVRNLKKNYTNACIQLHYKSCILTFIEKIPKCGNCFLVAPPWEECKEKVMVYDPDSVRTLLVHGEVKNEHPFVLSYNDYARILTNAVVSDTHA